MNKIFKKIFALLCAVCMIFGISTVICQAEGSSVMACSKNVKVGDTVDITVTFTAGAEDNEIWGLEGFLSYDNTIFSYVECSEIANDTGSNIKFSFSTNGNKTKSVKFTFSAIAAGKGFNQINNCIYSGAIDNSKYAITGCGVTIEVSDSQTSSAPSSSGTTSSANTVSTNAKLSSLTVSGATLSPKFSANRVSYTATVENSVDKCTVSAEAADSSATIAGTGTFDLNVGENTRVITVTAASGATKKYTVKIKRLAVNESSDVTSSSTIDSEISNEPLSVNIGGSEYKIVKNIDNLYIPNGYTISEEEYNGEKISVLTEKDGEYKLYYLTDIGGASAQLYRLKENGEFEKIAYMEVNGKLYIFEKPEGKLTAPDGYYATVLTTAGGDVEAYCSNNDMLNGFYYVYCYSQGSRGYYSYDSFENTLQRAPAFKPIEAIETNSDADSEMTLFDRFNALSFYAKVIIILIMVAILLVIVFLTLLIIKLIMKYKSITPPELSKENSPVFDETNVYSGFDFSYDEEPTALNDEEEYKNIDNKK